MPQTPLSLLLHSDDSTIPLDLKVIRFLLLDAPGKARCDRQTQTDRNFEGQMLSSVFQGFVIRKTSLNSGSIR